MRFTALLIVFSIVFNGASGAVLCLGGDGHIDIESKKSNSDECTCCENAPKESHDEEQTCSTCVDIPLSFGLPHPCPIECSESLVVEPGPICMFEGYSPEGCQWQIAEPTATESPPQPAHLKFISTVVVVI